jgi:hypothetical protein
VRKKLIVLVLVLVLCLVVLAPLASGQDISGTDTPTTEVTEPTLMPPVTEPTTELTLMPTVTEPTTLPTTEVTTTIPTQSIGGDQGWINVNCNVDGATVYFDGTVEGTIAGGVLTVAVYSTSSPIQMITVSMPGYTTWTGNAPPMPSPGQQVAVYATLNPLTTIPTTIPTPFPPVMTGAIYAQSSPAGAAIYLNGNFYGYSPLTIPSLAPGAYSMKAVLTGYTPDNTLVNVYVGQTAPYYPVLQQSPQPRQTGSLSVTSTPNNAMVYIDGNYYGTTPITVALYPGSHQVLLKYAGYNDYSTTTWITAGQTQSLPVTMSTATSGTVVINSVPGATVYMDSSPVGTISSSGSLTLSGITTGNHLFKVTAPGYNTWLNTVYIQANTVNTISAALTPAGVKPTPVPQTGGLVIASSPSNAETYIDNLYRGTTPLTVNDLTPGDHLVQVSEAGYVDYITTTTVTSGQTSPLAITLSAAPTPTPTTVPAPGPVPVTMALAALIGIGGYLRRRC